MTVKECEQRVSEIETKCIRLRESTKISIETCNFLAKQVEVFKAKLQKLEESQLQNIDISEQIRDNLYKEMVSHLGRINAERKIIEQSNIELELLNEQIVQLEFLVKNHMLTND